MVVTGVNSLMWFNTASMFLLSLAVEELFGFCSSPDTFSMSWALLCFAVCACLPWLVVSQQAEPDTEHHTLLEDYQVANYALSRLHFVYTWVFSLTCSPMERRERALKHTGPVWRAPLVTEVLRNLPFMRTQPRSIVEVSMW